MKAIPLHGHHILYTWLYVIRRDMTYETNLEAVRRAYLAES